MRTTQTALVAVADLHGHLDLFDALIERIDTLYPRARIVTLGDYVDNGPQIPALLDRLIALQEERPDRFISIMGNHDLALLRALGWPSDTPDPDWYRQWSSRYWNPGLGTPEAYGAWDLESFCRSFPSRHFCFLASLPWYYDDGEYFCVHAGLHPGSVAVQRARLAARELPSVKLHLPDAIREKGLATQHDLGWDRVVVSGHTNLGRKAVFSAPRRVCVSATADHVGGLLAVILPERRCWWTNGGSAIEVNRM